MIENRNEYQGHLSHQDVNMNFRRQNVYQQILKKDVQVFQDNNQTSQMLDQMKIPLNNDEQILIPEWLDLIFQDFGIPLCQAQYINIWDPIDRHYVDITSFRQIPSQNFKQASPIYIRYLPYQENALPPHANISSMTEEQSSAMINNPAFQINSSSQMNSYYQQNVQTHTASNYINKSHSNNKTTTNNHYQRPHANSLNIQHANSAATANFLSSNTTTPPAASKPKRQSMDSQSNYVMSHKNSDTNFAMNTQLALNHFQNSNQNFELLKGGSKQIELKQESSSFPIEHDDSILKNLKMEDQGSFACAMQNNTQGSFLINLKKEDREEQLSENQSNNNNNTNNMDLMNSSTTNGSGKAQNIKPRHKDSDQLSQKDTFTTTQQSDQQIKNHKQMPREKRVKERQISYVKGKVDEWRKLYDNGRVNPRGEIEKVNLDVAASLVGLSRKTLDDYYAQLRKAQKYAFDFDSNSSEKMGTLRKYVKKMSEKDVNAGDDESLDTENNTSSKTNFNTPQLKPSVPSESTKQELSMSVGYQTNSRKLSGHNIDLIHQNLLSQKPIPQKSILNSIKIDNNNNNINNNNFATSIANPQASLTYLEQNQQMIASLSFEQQTSQFKIENGALEEEEDCNMNLEDNNDNIDNHIINNNNNNNDNNEPMEQEEDNFTDYINSENNNDNPKQEQNDDQFN